MPADPGVLLEGGPMDGAIVPSTAPVLRPDWYRTWPALRPRPMASVVLRRPDPTWPPRDRRAPGRYVVDATRTPSMATWRLLAPEEA